MFKGLGDSSEDKEGEAEAFLFFVTVCHSPESSLFICNSESLFPEPILSEVVSFTAVDGDEGIEAFSVSTYALEAGTIGVEGAAFLPTHLRTALGQAPTR